ncbi:MAG: type II toxin-antitoxin system PemK/MazF family toxin [Deltaproteobacteria bacterium]|nr:type II toxin-antitoxin system PemK/MazF family toxin [Deltaproteobacteria bacterium]
MICNRFDVVVVPFPFIDRPVAKKRPALVLSNADFNGSNHSILAMITTKHYPPWPGDSKIQDYETAGLNTLCLVRFKLFTLDNRLILRKIGHLTHNDAKQIEVQLNSYLIGNTA